MAARRNATAVADGRVVIADGSAEALPDGPFAAAYAANTAQFWKDIDATLDAVAGYGPGVRWRWPSSPRFEGDRRRCPAAGRRTPSVSPPRASGDIRVETLVLRPTDVGCALGRLS